jgi:PAS domain S-box-containing protein
MKSRVIQAKRPASARVVELREFNSQTADRPLMRQLYRRAQAQLRKQRKNQKSRGAAPPAEIDTQRLLHELQVHQIELELQNSELADARSKQEGLLEKYTDLYDFAPVGYMSLDEQGQILEVNLTGSAMLGVGRSRLINRRLLTFVKPASRAVFQEFLKQIFARAGKQACEAALLREGGASFWANIHGAAAISAGGPRKWCRVAISDITALKLSEEAEHRVEALAEANHELRLEIVRRQALEESLKNNEQHKNQLLAQSHLLQDQLRHLSRQIMRAQEEERKRISLELHDVIAQTLTGINVQLAALAKQARLNPQGFGRTIAHTQRLVEKSVDTVHQFARELRPAVLDDLGLIPALHSFMKSFSVRTGIRTHLTAFAGVEQLDAACRTALFRVAQEALTNVARHAQARWADVSIHKLPDCICMKIKDDGKSFQARRMMERKVGKRLGLLGMRERMEMVGGRFEIESVVGAGTTIQARIPLGNAGGGGKRFRANSKPGLPQ